MKQKRTVGSVIKINLDNGYIIYGRILEKSAFAIYDSITKDELKDIDNIIDMPVLFIVSVYNSAITEGRWEIVGKLPLEEKLKILPDQFIQDAIDPNKFRIYNQNTGEMRPAKREDCIGLECAAVWEPEHVEDRIRDNYDGVPNKWLESLKIQ